MLITQNFVFLHLPKTGGMFVDGVLRSMLTPKAYDRKLHSLRSRYDIRVPFYKNKYLSSDRHASCKKIPDYAKGMPVIACIRNPFDWYVSNYKFGVWKLPRSWQEFWDDGDEIKEKINQRFPMCPDITFKEFVYASNSFTRRITTAKGYFDSSLDLGLMTLELLRCFCKDRKTVLGSSENSLMSLTEEYLHHVQFIHMENLNVELTQILETIGYEEQKLDYIKKHPKVYPGPATRPDSDKWEKYYDSELREEIRGRERVLFNLFPEYANE